MPQHPRVHHCQGQPPNTKGGPLAILTPGFKGNGAKEALWKERKVEEWTIIDTLHFLFKSREWEAGVMMIERWANTANWSLPIYLQRQLCQVGLMNGPAQVCLNKFQTAEK